MKKIILILWIIGILLINMVYAGGGGVAIQKDSCLAKGNLEWLLKPYFIRAVCSHQFGYNFGKVIYHNQSIGGTHYY